MDRQLAERAFLRSVALNRALGLLRKAADQAQDLDRPRWDFAVEIWGLHHAGLTNGDLRWLVYKGYVEHGVEATRPSYAHRSFVRVGSLSLTAQSCFLLTDAGKSLACQIGERRQAIGLGQNSAEGSRVRCSSKTLPHWDSACRELWYVDQLVKSYRLPARNQELILAVFEEESWPPYIDDPLPHRANLDAKARLHDTIKNLNRHQYHPLLHFVGNGTGEGVRWVYSPE